MTPLLSLEQVAEILGVSVAWVRDHTTRRNPRLPVVRLGGRRALLKFRAEDVQQFINAHVQNGQAHQEPAGTTLPYIVEHQTTITKKQFIQSKRQNDGNPHRITKKQFIRPNLREVAAYCQERGNQVDPQRWLDHYTANGWRVGRNPMKDWKAAVRNWEDNTSKNHRDGIAGTASQPEADTSAWPRCQKCSRPMHPDLSHCAFCRQKRIGFDLC